MKALTFYKSNKKHWLYNGFVMSFRIFGRGLFFTTKPLFSIRNGHTKYVKIGKLFIVYLPKLED